MFNDSKSLVLIVHANLMHLVTLLLYCSLRKVLSVARSNNHLCIQNLRIYQLPDESAKRETQYNQESGCVLYFHSNYIINSRLLLLSVFFSSDFIDRKQSFLATRMLVPDYFFSPVALDISLLGRIIKKKDLKQNTIHQYLSPQSKTNL